MDIFHNPEYFDSNDPPSLSLFRIRDIEENLRRGNNNILNGFQEDLEDEIFPMHNQDIPNENIIYPNNENGNNISQVPTEFRTRNLPKFKTTIVEKTGKSKGRLSKKNGRPSYKIKHTKSSRDDITSLLKRLFSKKTHNYINKKYNGFLLKKKKKKRDLLKKISPEIYRIYSTKDNQNFFNLYLYQLFSQDLSDKITQYSKDYNRKQIKSLYEKNEAKEVIEILNLTVKEMYQIYISNTIPDYNLENDLENAIKEDEEESEEDRVKYKNKVKEIANDLINFVFRKV